MTNNLSQNPYQEDEIDLREIIKILLDSKKLIIITTLIFTIASIIYSLSLKPEFESSTIIEIGYYEMPDGTVKLIEEPSDIISDLKTNIIYKKRDDFLLNNLIIKSQENKLIELQLTSKSSKKNENLLTEMINYLDLRHSKLALSKKDVISHEIYLIESQLSFLIENTKLKLETKISKLQNDLPILDEEISQLEQVVIDDSNNLKSLKGTSFSLERAASSPTLEQIISNYKSEITQLKRERNYSITELGILSQELDALKKNTFKSYELFELNQKLRNTKSQLQTLFAQTLVTTRPIGDMQTKTIKPEILLKILLGLIIGFISGVLLVFINNFIKSYRKSGA